MSPAGFLKSLQEAYRKLILIDLDAPENQQAINIAFMTQTVALDICRKLQKLEGFKGMTGLQLLEIA